MNYRIREILVACLYGLLIFLISCNRDITLKGGAVNGNGGFERNNSYEDYGDFKRQLYYTDSYDSIGIGGAVAAPLALSSQLILFPGSGGKIMLFKNRELNSVLSLDSGAAAAAGLAADPKQNIYVIDDRGKLYSFALDGAKNWEKQIFELEDSLITTFCDLLCISDGIIAATSNGLVLKISFEGKVLWSKYFGLSLTKYFPADKHGNIALALTQNNYRSIDSLTLLSSNGKIKWSRSLDGLRILKPPVMNNKNIYVIAADGGSDEKKYYVYCCDNKGKTKWKKKFDLIPRFVSAGNDGICYVIAYIGGLGLGKPISMIAALNKDGDMLWDKYIEATLPSPILISEKLLAFIGVDDTAAGFYFMNKKGHIENVISLSDCPPFLAKSAVTPDNIILMGALEKTEIIRIDETPMKKNVPW